MAERPSLDVPGAIGNVPSTHGLAAQHYEQMLGVVGNLRQLVHQLVQERNVTVQELLGYQQRGLIDASILITEEGIR